MADLQEHYKVIQAERKRLLDEVALHSRMYEAVKAQRAEAMRQAREAGCSPDEVAAAANITAGAVRAWEARHRGG